MIQYFKGPKAVAHLHLVGKGGRLRLDGVAYEEWIPMHTELLRCGATSTCRQVQRTGVKQEEKQSFESQLGSEIGNEAFGTIKAQIQSSSAKSKIWEVETVSERTVTFSSPACGSYSVQQYQLILRTYARLLRKRWFRAPIETQCELVEYLNFYYDGSESNHEDESCKCGKPDSGPPKADGVYLVNLGSLAIRVSSSYTANGFYLNFPNKTVEVPKATVLGGEIVVESDWLHASSLSLLQGAASGPWTAHFLPFDRVLEYRPEELKSWRFEHRPVSLAGAVEDAIAAAREIDRTRD